MNERHPLAPATIIGGIIVTVIGGLIVFYLTKNREAVNDKKEKDILPNVKKYSLSPKDFENPVTARFVSSNKHGASYSMKYDPQKQTTAPNQGRVIFYNQTDKNNLVVKFYELPDYDNVYVFDLKGSDKTNIDEFSIQVGKYKWLIFQNKEQFLGNFIDIKEGIVTQINLLESWQ